jgi:hypothetical protein
MLPVVAEPMTRRPAETLVVRARVTVVNGATGQAVATAQGQALRGHLDHGRHSMSEFAGQSSRQDGVDSPVNRRDMLSIIAQ